MKINLEPLTTLRKIIKKKEEEEEEEEEKPRHARPTPLPHKRDAAEARAAGSRPGLPAATGPRPSPSSPRSRRPAPPSSAAGGSRGASELRRAPAQPRGPRRRGAAQAAITSATPVGRGGGGGGGRALPPGGGLGRQPAQPSRGSRSPARPARPHGCLRRLAGGERRVTGASSSELMGFWRRSADPCARQPPSPRRR